MAYLPQSWDWLENRRSESDEVFRGMWKAMDTKAGKIRVAKTKVRRKEREKRKEMRREETEEGGKKKKEEKTKKEENNGSEEDNKGMEDFGWRKKSSKVQRRDQEIGFSKVLQVDPYLWKESEWKNVNEKSIGLCNRSKREICTKERKSISIVKERERRGVWVYWKTIEEGVYQTLEVSSNGTCVFCGKKEQ